MKNQLNLDDFGVEIDVFLLDPNKIDAYVLHTSATVQLTETKRYSKSDSTLNAKEQISDDFDEKLGVKSTFGLEEIIDFFKAIVNNFFEENVDKKTYDSVKHLDHILHKKKLNEFKTLLDYFNE